MGWEFRFFVRNPPAHLVDAARAAVGGSQSPEVREDAYFIAGPTCGMKVRAAASDADIGSPDTDV